MSGTNADKFDFGAWIEGRMKPGTFAHKVRRIREGGVSYATAILHFNRGWLFESLIAHRGVVARAGKEIGKGRNRMPDYFQKLGVCKEEAVEIAKQVNGGKR